MYPIFSFSPFSLCPICTKHVEIISFYDRYGHVKMKVMVLEKIKKNVTVVVGKKRISNGMNEWSGMNSKIQFPMIKSMTMRRKNPSPHI